MYFDVHLLLAGLALCPSLMIGFSSFEVICVPFLTQVIWSTSNDLGNILHPFG